MKYLFINSVYGIRSTGKIIADQCRRLQAGGNDCLVAYGREMAQDHTTKCVQIGTKKDYMVHAALSRIFDIQGLCSEKATIRLIEIIETYSPDVIWIHNLHGYYINFEVLFQWLKVHPHIKKYWTLHDCWAFTGHCAHFTMSRCDKWKTGCYACPQMKSYPKSYVFDHSKENFNRKKFAFTEVANLTLITPSQWLADLVHESFLAEYPVKVVNNTIDKNIFHPIISDFKKKYGIEDKHMVLGVAIGWEETKGLPDMLILSKMLDDDYVMVLVGVTAKQIKRLPNGVIGIERTKNQRELAQIYSAADVFVNPTHQDNFPTVNLEARACGTPVVTYNVGGSPESAGWENIVEENDIEGMAAQIKKLVSSK